MLPILPVRPREGAAMKERLCGLSALRPMPESERGRELYRILDIALAGEWAEAAEAQEAYRRKYSIAASGAPAQTSVRPVVGLCLPVPC
jgi:hypothetical protein